MKNSFLCLLSAIVCSVTTVSNAQIPFIKNMRQWAEPFEYKANLPYGALFVSHNKLVYNFYDAIAANKNTQALPSSQGGLPLLQTMNYHAYAIELLGGNENSFFSERNKLPYHHNYFIGDDVSRWRSNVPLYEQVQINQIYPGVDMKLYSNANGLKYDFIASPHAEVERIKLKFTGVTPQLQADGSLKMQTSINEISELKPVAYQMIDGKTHNVECNFAVDGSVVSYVFPNDYNREYELVIDPLIVFKTYSGSTTQNEGLGACGDQYGNMYAGSVVYFTGWPTTLGAYQVNNGGYKDIGINKYSANGSSLLYSTYLGGIGAENRLYGMLVNDMNELIVCGITGSADFPTTPGCFEDTYSGTTQFFITKFNATGTALLGSTFVGEAFSIGMGESNGMSLDKDGNIICATNSMSPIFPVTANAFQSSLAGLGDGVLFEMNSTLTGLNYSTYLGGQNGEWPSGVVKTNSGNYVVVGNTSSTNFPTTPGVVTPTKPGGSALNWDGFVTVISPTAGLLASTFVGTSLGDEDVIQVRVSALNEIYICGNGPNMPISAGVYNNPFGRVFLQKLNMTLDTLFWSTRIGDTIPTTSHSRIHSFEIDHCKNILLSKGGTSDLITTPNAVQSNYGWQWACVLSPNASGLEYATYFTGSYVEGGFSQITKDGIQFVTGLTLDSTWFTWPGACFPTKLTPSTLEDAGSMKFDFESSNVVPTSDTQHVCVGNSFQFPDGIWAHNIQSNFMHTSVFYRPLPLCDSLHNTYIVANPVPDTTISLIGSSLQANQANATSYQWLNCNTAIPIAGAISQSYTPIVSGNYAVILNWNGCVDTSTCYSFILTTSEHVTFNNSCSVYPNPTTGKLAIRSALTQTFEWELFDLFGRRLMKNSTQEIDMSNLPTGTYCLRINNYHIIVTKN